MTRVTRGLRFGLAALALLAACTLQARAQPVPAEPGARPGTPDSRAPDSRASDWSGQVILYGWFAGLEGDVTARNRDRSGSISLSPGDVLDKLELGLFGFAELRRGRFGALFDIAYIDLGDGQDVAAPVPLRVDGTTELLLVSTLGAWRAYEEGDRFVDLYAGGRFVSVDLGLTATGPGGNRFRASARERWVDPVFGVRAGTGLTERLSLWGFADIGGFGVGSDLSWQAFLGGRYALSERFALEAGFRYLSIDYSADRVDVDAEFWGPTVGLSFRF